MKAVVCLAFASSLFAACSNTPIASEVDSSVASDAGTAGTTGGAGATANAGATGGAGTTATAGATGSAGAMGTGGATGTAGAGGSTGTAGKTGTGGKGGATGSAGKTGTDGGASDAGDVCAALEAEYAAAIAAGQSCNRALDRLTCQLQVSSSVRCPGCKVSVDDDRPALAVQQKWTDASCAKKVQICPAIACINPGKGVCSPNPTDPNSVYGTCKSSTLTPLAPAP